MYQNKATGPIALISVFDSKSVRHGRLFPNLSADIEQRVNTDQYLLDSIVYLHTLLY